MTKNRKSETWDSLHDDWLSASIEDEKPAPTPTPRTTRKRPTASLSGYDWLDEGDPDGGTEPSKTSNPWTEDETPRPEPAGSARASTKRFRPTRRAISHGLAWTGGVATGLVLAVVFRPATPPVVIPLSPVATTIQEVKPVPVISPRPPIDGMVVPSPPITIAPAPPIPPRVEEETPAPPSDPPRPAPAPAPSLDPNHQPPRKVPGPFNYEDYRSNPPEPLPPR
jgi:hypothetical protein